MSVRSGSYSFPFRTVGTVIHVLGPDCPEGIVRRIGHPLAALKTEGTPMFSGQR